MPCSRHTSGAFSPASIRRRMAMICSSENRLLRMHSLLILFSVLERVSHIDWTPSRGSGHERLKRSEVEYCALSVESGLRLNAVIPLSDLCQFRVFEEVPL